MSNQIIKNDITKNITVLNFPNDYKEKVIVGIDEAGRGPVMGYLVYCALIVPSRYLEGDEYSKDSVFRNEVSKNGVVNGSRGESRFVGGNSKSNKSNSNNIDNTIHNNNNINNNYTINNMNINNINNNTIHNHKKTEQNIKNILNNLKDSKTLTPSTRSNVYNSFLLSQNFIHKSLSPSFITSKMVTGTNLNTLSWECISDILKIIINKFDIECVYIDTVGTPDKLRDYLKLLFSFNVVVEVKADSKFCVVSGASIVAKVVRDNRINEYSDGDYIEGCKCKECGCKGSRCENENCMKSCGKCKECGCKGIKYVDEDDSDYIEGGCMKNCGKESHTVNKDLMKNENVKTYNTKSNYGSGYPSDPITKKWLVDNCNEVFGWGNIVRYTWSTIKKILGENKSKKFGGVLKDFYYSSG